MSPRPLHTAAKALAAALLTGALSAGCKNDCQQLCHAMADYAAEDCGKEWSKEQLKSCMDDQKAAVEDNEEREQVCADITDSLREEWTCEDIAAYFD